jgi:serine protease
MNHFWMNTGRALAATTVALLLASCGGGGTPEASSASASASGPPAATAAAAATPLTGVTDQIIVQPASDALLRAYEVRAAEYARVLSSLAGVEVRAVRQTHSGAHVFAFPQARPAQQVAEIAAQLQQRSDVAYAEPDVILQTTAVPNDPNFSKTWHLREPAASAGGINAVDAWDLTTGDPNLVIAVIDTGVLRHQDFGGRLVNGYDFISNTTIANDGGGRDNDPIDPGDWLTSVEAAALGRTAARASSWHGTHVAGTIAATGNNSLGISGVNWQSKILPVRVLGKGGGYSSDIADGIVWAAGGSVAGIPANPTPARVINLSVGGAGACLLTTQNAVSAATSRNAVVVVAAGNENINVSGSQPANCSGVIAVGAVGAKGQRASYSNYGSGMTISAPGGDPQNDSGVLSLGDAGERTPLNDNTLIAAYGTSMAAPHVAGVVSLILSVNPSLTAADVKTILQSTARAFPTGTGRDCNVTTCGAGIVNAGSAVRTAATTTSGSTSTVPQSGVWWNPAQSGRGYVVEIRDGILSFGAYMFDDAGQPTWYIAGGAMQSATSFTGALQTSTGGQTLTGAYKAPTPNTSVGQMGLQFHTSTAATLTLPGGASVPLQRFFFDAGSRAVPTTTLAPESGIWWNPQESGRGFALEVQNGVLVMSAFMFDDAGRPTWYLSAGAMANASTYSGPLQVQANGQSLTGGYRVPSVTNANAGNVHIQFKDTSNAVMTLPDGRAIDIQKFRTGTGAPGVTMPMNQVLTARLIGVWDSTYRIVSSFTDYFLFNEVRESSITPGEYYVWGYNQFDSLAIGGWEPGLSQYTILAVGTTFDDFYVFDMPTATKMSGCYYLVFHNPTRLSSCYVMTGTKLAEIAPMDWTSLTGGKPTVDLATRAQQMAREDAQASKAGTSTEMAILKAPVLARQPEVDRLIRSVEARKAAAR